MIIRYQEHLKPQQKWENNTEPDSLLYSDSLDHKKLSKIKKREGSNGLRADEKQKYKNSDKYQNVCWF